MKCFAWIRHLAIGAMIFGCAFATACDRTSSAASSPAGYPPALSCVLPPALGTFVNDPEVNTRYIVPRSATYNDVHNFCRAPGECPVSTGVYGAALCEDPHTADGRNLCNPTGFDAQTPGANGASFGNVLILCYPIKT
jgi:hypothetical protein